MHVEQLRPELVAGAAALQRLCFPEPFPTEALWSADHLLDHIEVFNDGQFIVRDGDLVVASASNLVITEAAWARHSSWEETTGGFSFKNHDPAGSTLYGADISVHPGYRGQGIARLLYGARFQLVRLLGLVRYGTSCRIPDWAHYAVTNSGDSQAKYCAEVANGRATDRTLTPLLKMGLNYRGVSYNHMEDPESGNAAAILEWLP